MNALEKSGSYECVRISQCSLELLNTFSLSTEKEAYTLECYLKDPKWAIQEELTGLARTYVICDMRLNFIVGYFTLRAGQCHINHSRVVEPGIELAMYAVNDSYKSFFDNLTFSFGEWIFSQFILPKAKEAASIVGVKLIYLFALPNKPRLTEFYKRLGFINPKYASDSKRRIRTIIPTFGRGCIFMFRSL